MCGVDLKNNVSKVYKKADQAWRNWASMETHFLILNNRHRLHKNVNNEREEKE